MFRLTQPRKPLAFTGERLTGGGGGVEIEHLHRYCVARDLCVDRDVLDVASGEGYGTALLANVARSVVGVELDADAVAHACAVYAGENLRFEQGNALALPLPDNSVDVVVSLETLEHVDDQEKFLSEISRVLRPDGFAVISTPDRLVHSGYGMPANPYHVLELTSAEFRKALDRHFCNVRILSQKALTGSVIVTPDQVRTYERRDALTIEATDGLARAPYLLAIAGRSDLPASPDTVFADHRSLDGLLAQVEHAEADARIQLKRAADAEQRIVDAKQRVADAEQRVVESNRQRLKGDRDRQNLEEENAQLLAALAERDHQQQIVGRAYAETLSQLEGLRAATGVRAGLLASRMAHRLPPSIRQRLRATAYGSWRLVRRLQGAPLQPAPPAPVSIVALPQHEVGAPLRLTPDNASRADHTLAKLIGARFPSLTPPPVFAAASVGRRLSIVTDSIGPTSLFGGVGTSILLGALVAKELNASLRIVLRTEASDAAPIGDVLAANGVTFDGSVETAFAPIDQSRDLAMSEDDVVLTTSWWTTQAMLGTMPKHRIAALVQEDERMFYPYGDERLRCAETLATPNLLTIVNTRLLFDHFIGGSEPLPGLKDWGLFFEPAFPRSQPVEHPHDRRRLFFYARPNNARNLFWRGMEALQGAIEAGIFPASRWEIILLGKDVPDVSMPEGVEVRTMRTLGWAEYQRFVASVDAGFVLMDTPHPSYPPLDLAAAGAAVLTNRHGAKRDLSSYSANLLMASTAVDDLVRGLRDLQALAEDDEARARNVATDKIGRDWNEVLAPVAIKVAARLSRGGA
ncbi:class I SAM-dependent methyltransferase [Aureimonas altamirensis]|uniref:class I SAM-dependent methyltransferase n=1 Tax=Aureimonas altamirensis TaxID=370622 RepID=UPI0030194D63